MVKPTWKNVSRSPNSISGIPRETDPQASDVGWSRPVTQRGGTARRGLGKLARETSSPDMIEYARAVPAMSRAIGPSVSSDVLSGITPPRSMDPKAGLNPATPQSEAGMRMDPPVSLPTAQAHIPPAAATPDPPEGPPPAPPVSWGVRAGAECGVVVGTAYAKSCTVGL